MMNGKGIVWADGEDHRRQRSVMLPGFGQKESKELFPIFKDYADAISVKWLETIGNSNSESVVIDIVSWISRAALDSVGHAAFDVQFNTIQDNAHPLAKMYKNHFGDLFGLLPAKQIFMQAASKHIPTWILYWLADNGPSIRIARARDAKITMTNIARELVQQKANALLQGKGTTDILSLLVKANMDATEKMKLSEEEMLAQMRTLLTAGHETVTTTMSWMLLEIARHPKVQSRLRNEIRRTEAVVNVRGDSQLTVQDLEGMPYLNAVIKEGLRFHPAASKAFRIALQDEILPLSKPIVTKSGGMINEVLVPKGTEVVVSIAAYNRDKDVWGEDAHEFKPERWLDDAMVDRKLPAVGVYSHLLTFLAGPRSCLGWLFAVTEIQAFLWTLVGKFEFAMTDKAKHILRQPVYVVMAPMVDGELDRGIQLPLMVSVASQDD
ncbi:cytochrome P450 [Boletus edulis BED1]|uniref:Cytochrome P450 n=1 Tax=Boletus edulis BED1 TaxID=1328754 RepID=A0AAD4GAW9_BOLED|nr:cytochrome P450 [Boletus edulis BED1]